MQSREPSHPDKGIRKSFRKEVGLERAQEETEVQKHMDGTVALRVEGRAQARAQSWGLPGVLRGAYTLLCQEHLVRTEE